MAFLKAPTRFRCGVNRNCRLVRRLKGSRLVSNSLKGLAAALVIGSLLGDCPVGLDAVSASARVLFFDLIRMAVGLDFLLQILGARAGSSE